MQEICNSLRKQPIVNTLQNHANITTWFLLDRVRGEKTLPAFYQAGNNGLIASIEYLLLGTEHTPLLEVSPLLIKLNHTQLSETLHQHIQEERSGIFIQSSDENILPHLQYLFIMESDQQGKVYTRYYDPICWIALNLSLVDQQEKLWGNIETVYTLSPTNEETKTSYLLWDKPKELNYIPSQSPITLTHEFAEISKDLHLLYFFQKQIYQLNPAITDSQLSRVLINLKILNNKGIERIDYLQKLLTACLEQKDFALKPEVQSILNKDMLAYKKVTELEQLV